MSIEIDINFDFRSDTPPDKDPDSYSKTLKAYHKQLWTKPLPVGPVFTLEEKYYLRHQSELGEFYLGSDAITHSYKHVTSMSPIVSQFPDVVDHLFSLGCTIGAYTVFPSVQVDRKMTINQARGVNPRIKDRFDLTLECIRLFYAGMKSPLTEVFQRYDDFFALFKDFKGYVDFFLFQDMVADDYASVKFHLPFVGFDDSPLPNSVDAYLEYAKNTEKFIKARSQRMLG